MLYEFFSSSNLLLGSVVSTAFIGWEDPGGVARIRVTDQGQNNSSMLVDHLIVEGPVSAAEPGDRRRTGLHSVSGHRKT